MLKNIKTKAQSAWGSKMKAKQVSENIPLLKMADNILIFQTQNIPHDLPSEAFQ